MSHATEPSAGLDELLRRHALWRMGDDARGSITGIPTGFEFLDRALPGGGWPPSGLVEVCCPDPGSAALPLLLPALACLSGLGAWLALIAPPHVPYAPALSASGIDLARLIWLEPRDGDDRRWAFEQILRSGVCRATLAWARTTEDERVFSRAGTRRLQLAAESSGTLGVLVRRREANTAGSASVLRLMLDHRAGGAAISIDKCRGRPARGQVMLEAIDGGRPARI